MPAVTGSIRSAIYTWLSGQSAVTALVGARIFPLKAPQGVVRPLILYRRTSAGQVLQLDGSADTAMARFGFTIEADSYAAADAVRSALAEAVDAIANDAIAGLQIFNATIPDDGEEDDFAEPIDAGDTGVYLIHLSADFFFTDGVANP